MNTNQEQCSKDAYSTMDYWTWHGLPADHHVSSHAGFVERAMELAPSARVLDLGCGLGHVAAELARRGYDVTGLDRSQLYLDQAERLTQEAGVDVRFMHGDMTRLDFAHEFDAVTLWGNTFGTLSDEDNVQTLAGIKRALRPGGLALIDTQNYKGLPTALGRHWRFHDEEQQLLLLSEDTRDVRQGRFGFDWHSIDLKAGTQHTMRFSWRLYLMPELEQMLADGGIELLRVYGDAPAIMDWSQFHEGDPWPYSPEGFADGAAKRILLCRA